jgi:hypothetical protein
MDGRVQHVVAVQFGHGLVDVRKRWGVLLVK